jgi:hypothetical protein
LVVSYDVREKIWNPPMPLQFQRGIGNERRAFTPSAFRKLLLNALAAIGLTDANGDPLIFQVRDSENLCHGRYHERPTASYCTGHLGAQDHRHDDCLQSRPSRRDD